MSTTNPIPTIFDLCTPHQEVIEGKLQEDQFAAALSEVAFDHFATTLSSAPTARWRAEFDGVPEDTGR